MIRCAVTCTEYGSSLHHCSAMVTQRYRRLIIICTASRFVCSVNWKLDRSRCVSSFIFSSALGSRASAKVSPLWKTAWFTGYPFSGEMFMWCTQREPRRNGKRDRAHSNVSVTVLRLCYSTFRFQPIMKRTNLHPRDLLDCSVKNGSGKKSPSHPKLLIKLFFIFCLFALIPKVPFSFLFSLFGFSWDRLSSFVGGLARSFSLSLTVGTSYRCEQQT